VGHSRCACSAKTAVSPNRYSSPAKELLGGSVTDVGRVCLGPTGCSAIRLAAGPRWTIHQPDHGAALRPLRPRFGIAYSPGQKKNRQKPFLRAGKRAFSMTAVPLLAPGFSPEIRHASSAKYDLQRFSQPETRFAFENEYIANGSGSPSRREIRHAPNTSARQLCKQRKKVDRAPHGTGAVLRAWLCAQHKRANLCSLFSPFGGDAGRRQPF